MIEILAYDRMGSVRTFDEDGRLRVGKTPISKSNICPYRGNEIPEWSRLGLDPERIYHLLRDPAELARAVPTFNGLPVLDEHHHVTADNPRRDLVVGTTGNEASFETPFLFNSLTIWDGSAIDRIKSGEQRDLSSAYRYRADMTPGEFENERYDGVMRDIRGSHVAVVPTGRAGPDVLVADSQPESMKMPKKTPARSDKLIAALKPFLANDADMDACKKALDEDMATDPNGASDDVATTLRALLDGKVDSDVIEQAVALVDAVGEANPVEDEDEGEEERADKLRAAGLSDDEIAKCLAALTTSANDEETEAKAKADEAAGAREADVIRKAEEAKTAMDAAIRQVENRTIKRMNDLHAAREAVKPIVGVVAMDSAEEVYGFALKKQGISLSGIPAAAYGAMFKQIAAHKAEAPKATVAMDGKAALSFLEKHPGLSAVKVKA